MLRDVVITKLEKGDMRNFEWSDSKIQKDQLIIKDPLVQGYKDVSNHSRYKGFKLLQERVLSLRLKLYSTFICIYNALNLMDFSLWSPFKGFLLMIHNLMDFSFCPKI